MGGYLEKTTQKDPNNDNVSRHPLQADAIGPLKNGKVQIGRGRGGA